jgi:hypothetical protein
MTRVEVGSGSLDKIRYIYQEETFYGEAAQAQAWR